MVNNEDSSISNVPRWISTALKRDLDSKIILLSGPRQSGKTHLARSLGFPNVQYLNYDDEEGRTVIRARQWRRDVDLVIFDELHKLKGWKRWIKGVYDTEGVRPRLLVTGSARLDVHRKGGDSLAGRHFLYRLHPFTPAELTHSGWPGDPLNRLLEVGGFPEPFLDGSEIFYRRWRRSHLDRILREDLLDLDQVRDLKSIEILVELLSTRVGSLISYASLARDLHVSPPTVKRWLFLLENLFVVFPVTPYTKSSARSLQKEPKYYFYDVARVKGDDGARFENLVACALLARNTWVEDTQGFDSRLHFVRDKEKREVDFLTLRDGKPEWLIEAKASDTAFSSSLAYYRDRLQPEQALQVVRNSRVPRQSDGLHMVPAHSWLASLSKS